MKNRNSIAIKRKQKVSNRTILNSFLILGILWLQLFSLTPKTLIFTIEGMDNQKFPSPALEKKTIDFKWYYKEKMNNRIINRDFTFIQIPSINFSAKIEGNESFGYATMVFHNPKLIENNKKESYYYQTKIENSNLFSVYANNNQDNWGDYNVLETLMLNVNPYDVTDFYLGQLNKTINLFSEPFNISFDIISYYYSIQVLKPLILSNNSFILPIFGPYEAFYYYELKNKQENLIRTLHDLSEKIPGLIIETYSNKTIIEDDTLENTIDTVVLHYDFHIEYLHNNYELKIFNHATCVNWGNIVNNSLYLSINSTGELSDLNNNITINFESRQSIRFDPGIVGYGTTEQKSKFLNTIDYLKTSLSFLIVVLIRKNRKREHKKSRRFFS